MNNDECSMIQHHYEGETERSGMEMQENYLQGLKDGFLLMIHLGIARP